MSTENGREALVYIAKLAEQAERYDGILMYIAMCIYVVLLRMMYGFHFCVSYLCSIGMWNCLV